MVISAEIAAQILRLYNQERWPLGTIARHCGVHHSAVRRVLDRAGLPQARRAYRSKIAPYAGFIEETLRRYPEILASRVHAMCCERGYQGGQSHFRDYIARRRPRKGTPR